MKKERQYFSKYAPAALEIYEDGFPDFEKNYAYANKWWTAQVHRCVQGFEPTKGDWIPGDYYFHLNFVHGEVMDEKRNDKSTRQFPYNDCDHELAQFLWECEEDRIDALIMKGRRARFSTMMSSKLLCRYTFYPGTTVGVGAYGAEYVEKIASMINMARSHLPDYISYSTIHDTPKILEAGYKKASVVGQKKVGSHSKIYYGNFGGQKLNTGVFRRLSLKYCLVDEIGENPYLMDCKAATEECLMDGGLKYGIFVFGGTSNLMKNPSKDLGQLVRRPEDYGFRMHFIPRQRFFYLPNHDFCDIEKGTATPEQQAKAKTYLRLEAEKRYKLENKTSYYAFLQENPTEVEEMFMGNSASNMLPMDKVNQQIKVLNDWDSLKTRIRKYNLHWKNGRYNPQNPQVEWDTTCEDGEYHILEMPDEKYKDLDIGGVDTYYRSGAPSSDSIGVMYMFRRENVFDSGSLSNAPIVEYGIRYPTNEQFYDGCLKLAVAYSHPGSPSKFLSEFDPTFLMWLEKCNALRFCKEKPTAINGSYSNSGNTYMLAMTGSAKAHGVALMVDYYQKYIQNIGFERLLEDSKRMGVFNCDFCSAFLVTLVHNIDLQNVLVKQAKNNQQYDDFPSFTRSSSGILTPNSYDARQSYAEETMVDNFLNS